MANIIVAEKLIDVKNSKLVKTHKHDNTGTVDMLRVNTYCAGYKLYELRHSTQGERRIHSRKCARPICRIPLFDKLISWNIGRYETTVSLCNMSR